MIMASLARTSLLLGITLAVISVLLLGGAQEPKKAASAADARPLVFCAEPAAMPRTGKATDGSPQGLDVAVARLVCQKLGRKLEIHWCTSPSCSQRCLREKRCDVILGHPHNPEAAKDIAWSVPYAGSQFGLVLPKGEPSRVSGRVRTLADLKGKRLGIVAGSVSVSDKDHILVPYKTREEVLRRF